MMASDATSTLISAPARSAGAVTFGGLFALESFARAINSTVVSLQAYDLLGSSQKVSVLSTSVSLTVLTASLGLPLVLARLPRRWAYSLGVAALIAASISLASFTLIGQVTGMMLRNLGASFLNITLALYILDHFRRADLGRVEPIRLSMSTMSWTLGPFLGVWLYTTFGHAGPQTLSIVASGLLLALFWQLRLNDHPILRPGPARTPNPLKNIGRFVSQPRLRLAWLIAFGRSCFWVTFFIYAPLLMVESGLGKQAGGWLVSASQVLLVSAYGFGRLAQRTSIRAVIAGSFALGAAAALAAGLAGTAMPYLAGGFLLIGSVAAAALDAVGGIPFLRAVKVRERPEMATVYRTYIDLSELIPSFLFAIALGFFEIGVVFVLLGVGMAIIGAISWAYLPRSL